MCLVRKLGYTERYNDGKNIIPTCTQHSEKRKKENARMREKKRMQGEISEQCETRSHVVCSVAKTRDPYLPYTPPCNLKPSGDALS